MDTTPIGLLLVLALAAWAAWAAITLYDLRNRK